MSGEHRPPSSTPAGTKQKPALDENSFQQLLAAAYVLQQHNDSLRAKDPAVNTSAVLSEIAEIQSLVRDGRLDIPQAAKLIAERLRKITSASGVSISLVTDGYLDCVAESGVPATIPGSSVASHSLVATEKLRNGEIFESAGALEDIRLSVDVCRELGVASLIAAPIHEFGEIAGLVEVRWDRANAFQESDVRACRLMAGLTTSVIERKSRSGERDGTAAAEDNRRTAAPPAIKAEAAAKPSGADNGKSSVERCRVCGRPFGPYEAFCGNCSLPRVAVNHSSELQSKWASLWYMQQAQGNLERQPPVGQRSPTADEDRAAVRPMRSDGRVPSRAMPPAPAEVERKQPPAPVVARGAQNWQPRTPAPAQAKSVETRPVVVPVRSAAARPARTPIAPPQVAARPTQAVVRANSLPRKNAAAPSAIEKHQPTTVTANSVRIAKPVHKKPGSTAFRFNLQVRDALVAGGAILLALVMLFLAGSVGANSDLSWSEKLLVNLGITQPPASNLVFAGNPETRVWVDVHTGLYYCPGSDLYGKTPGGRFTDQLDAQKDQFEPASRSVCK